MFTWSFQTPACPLTIGGDESSIRYIRFDESENVVPYADLPGVVRRCHEQLLSYFEGTLTRFDLPLNPQGTDFQQKVWLLLQQIPYGQTISYQELALRAGDRMLTRAVGLANGRNPIPVIIPCHRVIGSNGSLTGFAGGLHVKKWLITHEQRVSGITLF